MKKTFALALAAIMAFSITACDNKNSEPDSQTQAGIQTTTAVTTTEPTSEKLKSEDYPLQLSQDNYIYDNAEFIEVSASGEPQSYEELNGFLECDDYVNFLKYEITYIYTPEEAVDVTGYQSFYDSNAILYKAMVTYDYISQTPLNMEINIAKAGNSSYQVPNDPPYLVGQIYAANISGLEKTWSVSIPELTFAIYTIKNKEFAYHIRFDNIKIKNNKHKNLDLGVLESEKKVVTSTRNNPVKYTEKFYIEDLAEFLRDDWSSRGYVFQDLVSDEIVDDEISATD